MGSQGEIVVPSVMPNITRLDELDSHLDNLLSDPERQLDHELADHVYLQINSTSSFNADSMVLLKVTV